MINVIACSINILKELREDQQMIVSDPRFAGPIERWQVCPSSHCERWQECRAPHECSGTGKNLTPDQRARLRPPVKTALQTHRLNGEEDGKADKC